MTTPGSSITGRAWHLHDASDPTKPLDERLSARFGVSDARLHFAPTLEDLHDPFLLGGVERAADRLLAAIDAGERIAIFGDYDVDGLTGTAVLATTLTALGGSVATMIPSRLTEGYGLSHAAVKAAADAGARVLCTVDCGVANIEEIADARSKGLEVIVCDHHELGPMLPDAAYAILHPRQPGEHFPFPHLTGVGVAFTLAQALLMRRDGGFPLSELLDLVALGTLADQGALTGENRTLVSLGLAQLAARGRPGLAALLAISKVEERTLTEEHVHFQLAPRLNAAGRMAHPRTALRLLLTSDPGEALACAEELEQLNRSRRARTEEIAQEILGKIAKEPPTSAVVLKDPSWSIGLLGLMCSRVAEHAGLPTVLLEDRGDTLTGSARSVPGFDVHAALAASRARFTKFGGHAQAAGFTLPASEYDAFRAEFLDACAQAPKHVPTVELFGRVASQELSMAGARTVRRFGPFGPGMEQPTFLVPATILTRIDPLGDGSHLRLTVDAGLDAPITVTAFRWGKHRAVLSATPRLDLALTMKTSTWRGAERLELHLVDARQA